MPIFQCGRCGEEFPEFQEYKIHQWLKHEILNGGKIWSKDLKEAGYSVVKTEYIKFLLEKMLVPGFTWKSSDLEMFAFIKAELEEEN